MVAHRTDDLVVDSAEGMAGAYRSAGDLGCAIPLYQQTWPTVSGSSAPTTGMSQQRVSLLGRVPQCCRPG